MYLPSNDRAVFYWRQLQGALNNLRRYPRSPLMQRAVQRAHDAWWFECEALLYAVRERGVR